MKETNKCFLFSSYHLGFEFSLLAILVTVLEFKIFYLKLLLFVSVCTGGVSRLQEKDSVFIGWRYFCF